ncbi:MAG: hypothetical protein IT530_11930 [Burkholderiales bacterium]|nr:hypothetical protein [Burkholderiales bacterium]
MRADARAGTPRAIVGRLAADIGRVLRMTDVRDKPAAQGNFPWSSTPEQFAAVIESEIARFAAVVKAAHIKTE